MRSLFAHQALGWASLIVALLISAPRVVAGASGKPAISPIAYRSQSTPTKRRTAGVGWTFRDIDVRNLLERLKRFGVEMPVPLEGQVTVDLSLRAPWRSFLRPSSYEVEGDIRSARLTVAGVELQTLSAHLLYTEGVFELTKMSFALQDKQGRSGTVSGTARVQVRPAGDLSAELKIDQLPLASLFDTLPELADKASGTASGQFAGRVSVARLRELAAWRGQGRLTLNDLQALGLPPLAASVEVRLGAGRATLTRLTAQVARATVTASGNLALAAPFNFAGSLRAAIPDLAWLNKLDADFRPPLAVGGSFSLQADADGSLGTKHARLRGALDGRNLKAGTLLADRLQVPFDGTLERIRLNSVRAELYGGRITANFSLPTRLAGNVGVGVRVRNVDLGALASAALEGRQPWRAFASGTLQLQVPASQIADFETWSGRGQLSVDQGNLFGIEVSRVAANVEVDKGELAVRQLAADSALVRLTGSARLKLSAPFGFGAAVRMENVDFGQLNRLSATRLPVAVGGRAGISTSAQGTLQPLRLSVRGGVATRLLRADDFVFDTFDFKYTADLGDDPRDLAKWRAQLDASWGGARVGQAALPGGSLAARLAEGTLDVSRLTSEGGSMRVGASGRVGVLAPHKFALKLAADNVDLSMANGLPVRPPVSLAGAVSTSADVQGQLVPLKVDGHGKFRGRNLRAAAAALDSLSFDFAAENDSVTLSGLSLVGYRGRVEGRLTVPLSQASQANIDLRWQRVNVGRAFAGLLNSDVLAHGGLAGLREALAESRFEAWTWGSVAVRAPAGKLLDPAAWTGEVDVSLAEMRLADWVAKKAFIRGRLADGKAELTRLALDVNRARLRGTASLDLAEPFHFKSNVSLDGVNLGDLNTLPEAIRPPVKVGGEVSVSLGVAGTLQPLEVTGTGSLTGEHLQAGGATVDRLVAGVSADPRRLALTRFHADLYRGSIEGTAKIGLKADEAGQIDLAWHQIDLGQFVTDVARLPVTLKGQVSGELDIEIPAGQLAQITAWAVDAAFDTTPITAESASVGQFRGHLAYRQSRLDYGVDGTLLRGRIELAGRWQPKAGKSANEGHLDLAGARLDALATMFSRGSPLGSLSGQIRVNLRYQHDEKSGLPAGTGDLAIDDVRLNGVSLLDEVRGVIRLAADRVEIVNLQGLFADGALTASAVAFFDPGRRGSLQLDIDGAEMAQALAPRRELAAKVRGTFDARLQAFFGGRRPAQAAGAVSVRNGSAGGLEFSGVRVPVAGTFDPVGGNGTLQLHGASGELAMGRFVGDFDLTLAGGLDLKGHGKFSRVDLRTLVRQSASARRLASGKVDGVYTLAGRNVRTVADLTGTLSADLTNTQALSLPVMQQTLPYLTGGVSGSTTFDNGELRAHLSRGVVRIDRFTLASGSVQIYAEGTVSLASRLNLNVMAKTGQLNARTQAIALLASRIALVVSPPVGLLLEVTQFLSNQVINLEITGTVRSPTVRIQPLQILGQEAARFFLYQAVP